MVKYCSSCGNPIDATNFYKDYWKTRCLNCYRKEEYKGWGQQKQKIKKLLVKYGKGVSD